MTTSADELVHAAAVPGRAFRGCRQSRHLSQARACFSSVGSALGEGVHRATRTLTSRRHRVEALGNLKDEAARCVERHPGAAVGAAFGAGLALGLASAWVTRCHAIKTQNSSARSEAEL